ncbi:o-succinylbenzoate synthase [Rufibacter glacialis]|uniref:o-succinylbenzoate synthase n=1 Tax=Rufibacter glacialis TaxID=1259555 RepID=A0A5M8QB99_9BACT|nr:o-succinylbenzoate synthase [Rufibacter glacialis]KAA6431792.1 o-succinylbenzoate synthase [Rufibacter glacialis]GGK81521.1 o-succinylbenzoate synthase [Rufibacter glacialis]
MPFVLTPFHRDLSFKFDARTSRGAMQIHQAHYLRVHHTQNPEKHGWGECSPLPGLSPDFSAGFGQLLEKVCHQFNALQLEDSESEEGMVFWKSLEQWPSICFAAETAWVDYFRGAKRLLYPTDFSRSERGIKINGLIWMGDPAFMREQIEKKLAQGFTCLKLKIGGLDFAQELRILQEIRKVAGPEVLELRLDANGAFSPTDAEEKLRQLAHFGIHSLEQPIKPGQGQTMQLLSSVSPIPIALDEELIGVKGKEAKWNLLDQLRPPYIIIKPTLVGGLVSSREWIEVAKSLGVDWWLTSALESNIGLNAIAQFAAELDNPLPQGLGTGQLYHNNFASPLEIRGEELWYNPANAWELPG